jgi:UDP-N-acetylmuramyl tripeptide synthase
MSIFSPLKKILGQNLTRKIRPLGHGTKGYLASLWYRRPANKLKVIGITGTKGKTTTSMFLGRILNISGVKTGYITTGAIYLGESNTENELISNQIQQLEDLEKFIKNNTQSK